MNVSLVTETFPPEINGVAMTFGVIARELGRLGHRVTVHRPRRRDLGRPCPDFVEVPMPGLPIPGYPLLRLGLPAGRALARRWRKERPDIVHVATEGPLGASAVSAARALGIPVTSSFHTNFHSYARHYGISFLRGAALAWLRRVHNRTRRTFVPTARLCAELADSGFRDLTLLSRGVDTRRFNPGRRSAGRRTAWGAGPDDPVVLHVGRMAREKNYALLLRCHAAMLAANPRCRFVYVGDGPLRKRIERGAPRGIFTGFISSEELAEHYASADAYVHASLTETFGNVLTEAMASGLAVAGFDYAAAQEFVADGQNGFAVPCDRPDELEAAAVRLASDAALRGRLRSAAAASLEARSWRHVIARFESDLMSVIDEARAPGAGRAVPSVAAPTGAVSP